MDDRYTRQELFPPIGREGQEKLQSSRVLVMGAGALGSSTSEMLVRAGVGEITIIDRDVVEPSNLPRQNLFTEDEADGATPKALAAKERLQRINRQTTIHAYVLDADAPALEKLVRDVDLMVDGSDNFEIRFILNDLSQKYGVPWIFGASAGSVGMACAFLPGETPCFQCLLRGMPEGAVTCSSAGIIAPAVQMTTSYQAAEAIKLLTGNAASLQKKLLLFDIWNGHHQQLGFHRMKNRKCPSCGDSRTYPYLTETESTRVSTLCGQDTVHIRPAQPFSYDFTLLERHLRPHGKVKKNDHVLTCLLSSYRLAVFADGRILIHGTNNSETAKAIYTQYIAAYDNTVKKEQEAW